MRLVIGHSSVLEVPRFETCWALLLLTDSPHCPPFPLWLGPQTPYSLDLVAQLGGQKKAFPPRPVTLDCARDLPNLGQPQWPAIHCPSHYLNPLCVAHLCLQWQAALARQSGDSFPGLFFNSQPQASSCEHDWPGNTTDWAHHCERVPKPPAQAVTVLALVGPPAFFPTQPQALC